jgi:DNA polymerase III epsilon subunit-like protein
MRELLEMIAVRCHGGSLPDRYCVIDFETSGFSPTANRILSVGYAMVNGGRICADIGSVILKHDADVPLPPGAMAVNGITREKMNAEGVPQREYMAFFLDTLEHMKTAGFLFAGHNIITFDIPFLEHEAQRIGRKFAFGPNDVLDVGLLVKADQLGMFPWQDETLKDYFTRVYKAGSAGVSWKLDYCYTKYKLHEVIGARGEVHDAGDDCLRTHLVFERMKQVMKPQETACGG